MNETHKNKLLFFEPKKELGGAETLFIRLITEFIKQSKFQLQVCDYSDGVVVRAIQRERVQFIPFRPGGIIDIDSDTTVIMPAIHLYRYGGKQLKPKPDTKLFLWELGAFTNIEAQILVNLYRSKGLDNAIRIKNILENRRNKKIGSFLKTAMNKGGFVFMSLKDYYYNKVFFNLKIEPLVLPIPVNIPQKNWYNRKAESNEINIAWISRLVSVKLTALYLLIDDLATLQNHDIVLHVIGNGPENVKIKKYADNKSVQVKMAGYLVFEDLINYVKTNIDIAFSMGTSALEFASVGVPTVLTIGAMLLKNDLSGIKRYKWIFDDEGNNLASEPTITKNPKTLKSIDDIIKDFVDNPVDVSNKTYLHVKNNHEVDIIVEKIVKLLIKNTLTYNDVLDSKVLEYTIWDITLQKYLLIKRRISNFIKQSA